MKPKEKRQFLGKIGNDKKHFTDRLERAIEKKHLKAYLRGATRFTFGWKNNGERVYYRVNQKFIKA